MRRGGGRSERTRERKGREKRERRKGGGWGDERKGRQVTAR